jgi:hypothetical protein
MVMKEALEMRVKEAHEGKVVYQVSRDSTAIEVREQQEEGKDDGRESGFLLSFDGCSL